MAHSSPSPRQSLFHAHADIAPGRWLLLCLWVILVAACSRGGVEQAGGPDAAAVAENNRGVGLMGRFEYAKAYQVFAALVHAHPEWPAVRVNLAIATLNRQQEGDEKAALAMAKEVLEKDPANLRAHYVAGLMELYLSSPKAALDHFRMVAEADPHDAYAAYYLAQCLAQESQYEQALTWYQRAIERDPYLRSAYYGAFQTQRRLKRSAGARELIGDYQKLANNPRAHLAEFKYTRMGPKAEALAIDAAHPMKAEPPAGPVFAKASAVTVRAGNGIPWHLPGAERALSLTVADIQGDGHDDLFVADALQGNGLHNLVLLAGSEGELEADLEHPLARVGEVNAALWGDFDNDGLVDVYLCRRGANQLWRQVEKGRWEDVTQATGTGGGQTNTVDGVMFDADHDGDLDLFLVNADAPNELLNNNRDGTFRAIAAQQGIAGDGRPSRQALPVDLDGDRDLDLVVIHDRPPHEVYLNDRLWAYHPAPGFADFQATETLSVVAGDLDADGQPELYTLSSKGQLTRWRPDDQGDWRSARVNQGAPLAPGRARLAVRDVDGDGVLDLLVSTPAGWAALRPGAGKTQTLFSAAMPQDQSLAGWAPMMLDPAQGPAVLGVDRQGGVAEWLPGPGRLPFLALTLSGKEDAANAMRSNASGIGTRVAVRADSRWTIANTLGSASGPGQSLQPLMIGLGGAPQVDFVAIDWSDGVFQSEVDLAPGTLHEVAETQRQLSSCPVLFAWNGREYAFVADLLGVGGLGYAVGPGEYASPRPWENLLLPADLLQPKEGRMILKLTEPMEEVTYLDDARLVAYDLPQGWHMVLDERMGIAGPAPTGEPRFFRRELLPSAAVNDRGADVTQSVLEADGHAAPVGPLDPRFIGRLAGEHVLTLSFPAPLDIYPGEPLLMVDGWVEYPYSQTSFAAWQAGAHYAAPTLEARGADGTWHTVLKKLGYPAGMPRRMSVPLPALPAGTRELRLRTNMEVYWDRIALALAEPAPEVRRQVLPLRDARLSQSGFALRATGPQRRPDYDYQRRSPFWDTRYPAGFYTRLGPVTELVARTDDALAVFGPGEEVQLEFAAPRDPSSVEWRRRFVLEAHGWTKDMDLYTKDGETVGPLPESGKPTARRDELHARYNTRYQAGW